MPQLTSQGQNVVTDLARRHGFSDDAVSHMLLAVLNGNGDMAQFFHPEFGGSGQWMRGGMLMLGDMFNQSLKGRVDALCHEIAEILASQPGLLHGGGFPSQRQEGGEYQDPASGAPAGQPSLLIPDPSASWWPAELGMPNATGTQDGMHYAYFGEARRLAVQTGGEVRVYDTLDHRIGGVSQQQGSGDSITFFSQHGRVDLTSLPVVSRNKQPRQAAQAPAMGAGDASASGPDEQPGKPSSSHAAMTQEAAILSAIERLSDLRARGLLTDEEFAAKKNELLGRL